MASAPSFLQGNGASYLRVGSIAIAAYDYIVTLPAEWRFYRGQKPWRISPGCMLFILIRYLSIATIVVSNVGYFGTFSQQMCDRYYIAAPVFKVLQTMVSQVILGIRAYNISRRSQWVMYTYFVLFILLTAAESFTNLWDRVPVQKSNNCTPGNSHLSVWLYYVLAMFYDLFTLVLSTYFLVQFTSSFSRMTGLIRLMFYDGLGYFAALTGANIFNLVLYRTANESYQSSGASVGYAVTWIMSQRILIHLRDAAAEHQVKNVIVSHKLNSGRDVSRAMRSQFNSSNHKDRLNDEYDLKSRSTSGAADSYDHVVADVELDIQVQVEQTVTVDYIPPGPRRHPDPGHVLPR